MIKLPSYIDKDAWQGFIEMRKSIKKPLTERAMKLAIHKLENLLKQGQDPTKVLDQSTFNSWQGIFAVKEDYGLQKQSIRGNGRDFAAERDESRIQRLTGRTVNQRNAPVPPREIPHDTERHRSDRVEERLIQDTRMEDFKD